MVGPSLVSVIVPTYENADGLRRCLAGLRRLDDPTIELIVVDDASTADLSAVCREFGARHVRLVENRGPGEARNAGARVARGDILAFTDSDCVPTSDWLSRIRANLAEPGVVATAGTYGEDLSGTFIARVRQLEARFYHLQERTLVNSFISANFAIRREVLEAVGGFPALRVGEDLVLGYRLKEAGYDVLWDYGLRVDQAFRQSITAYFRQQRLWSAAILKIHLDQPATVSMTWSVRRSGLAPQLPCQAVFLATAAAGFVWPGLWVITGAAAAALLAINFPFLTFVRRQQGLAFAARVFLSTWWVRTTAWGLGCCSASLSRRASASRDHAEQSMVAGGRPSDQWRTKNAKP